jgi:hypothetical protein
MDTMLDMLTPANASNPRRVFIRNHQKLYLKLSDVRELAKV